MKKLISIILCLIIVILPICANATYLYTESFTENVTGGVVYEQRNILTENGWIRAYIAYVDLNNPNAAIKVMTAANGTSYLENVKDMATRENATIAINADFFNVSSTQTNMIGMVYKDGELISTPALDNQVSFVLTDTNEVIMDYFSFTSRVISPQGYETPVYQINKVPVDTGAITMLTSAWASTTWGNGLKEMVVENNVVKEIREAGSAPGVMPTNGYVLVTNPQINGFFDNFKIGDPITVETILKPNVQNIKEATGGNTLIVNGGAVANFTGNIAGYAQRTSVGVTQDGKTLILAATDGRQTDCRGLTQTEMANLMISLGAYKAINLDGGGSTSFIKKDSTGYYETKNSVSSLRKVSTAIGVFDNGLKGTYAKTGTLSPDKTAILQGDSVNLNATFYDEYGNIFYPDPASVRYYDAAGNSLVNGVFSPTWAGAHTVYAACGDAVCSAEIIVSDKINSINIENTDLSLSAGNSVQLSVSAYDTYGRKISVNPNVVQWASDNAAISVNSGSVYAQADAGAVISVSYDGKYDYIAINKELYGQKAPLALTTYDNLRGTLNSGTKIAVSGNVPKGTTLLNRYYSMERLQAMAAYDKSYVTSNYYTDAQSEKTVIPTSYTVYNKDNATFATLGTSEGYVKSTSEWINLSIASRGTAKNLVIISEKSPDELPAHEGKMLKNILKESVSYGKNVFYVYSGTKPEVHMESGVRYISLGTVTEFKTSSMYNDAKYCPYLVFYVNGDELRYEFAG